MWLFLKVVQILQELSYKILSLIAIRKLPSFVGEVVAP